MLNKKRFRSKYPSERADRRHPFCRSFA